MENKEPKSQHILKLTGNHPKSDFRIIQMFTAIEDPRGASCNFKHPLTSVLFITIVCCLCGADDWEAIVLQANSMVSWLAKFVDMTNGVPSVRTFKRVFAILNPKELDKVLRNLAELLKDSGAKEVVSFDGKTMRGTSSSEHGLKAIHMLNAWSHDEGICIGHVKVDDKSNEITALPQLMELLDLKDTIITTDALNTQKETVKKAVGLGADYVLPIKGNHATCLEEIETLFKGAEKQGFCGYDGDEYETLEKSHGRIESRKYHSLDAKELPCALDWEGLCTVGKVVRKRTEKGKTSTEVEYYISSCEIDARLLEKVVRGHWGIENSLHWVLDVTFREDKIRYRDRVGAINMASIRKLVLGLLTREKSLKCGKKNKRLIAATDPKYRERVLKLFF